MTSLATMRRAHRWLAAGVLAASVGIAGCGSTARTSTAGTSTAGTSTAGTSTAGTSTAPASTSAQTAAAPGPAGAPTVSPVLRFAAPLVGGGTFDGASYSGKPVAFWFWAPT